MASEADKLEQWFSMVDTNHDGRIEGIDAAKFFQRSGLPRETLKEVFLFQRNLLHTALGLGQNGWKSTVYDKATVLWGGSFGFSCSGIFACFSE